MQDIFKEQLIKRSPTTADRLKKTGLILIVIIVMILASFIIPAFAPIIVVAVGFGAYIIMGRLKKEYEYSFTNGELDIDVIYNKSSRKRIFNGNVKDFEIMAHIDDPAHKNTLASAAERLDCSTGIMTDRSYAFLTNYKGKKIAVVMEPNNEMMEALAKVLTRRKFHPKK